VRLTLQVTAKIAKQCYVSKT